MTVLAIQPPHGTAAQRRIALLRLLTPDRRCAHCGRHRAWRDLEVDHVDGRTWHKHLLNCRDRVTRYWREFASGVRLRALCKSCNSSDGQRLRGRPRYA